MKSIYISFAGVVLAAVSIGCTQQSKQEYNQAGQSLKNAAVETGKAVTTDAKVAGKAAQNGVNAAKKTADKDKHEDKSSGK